MEKGLELMLGLGSWYCPPGTKSDASKGDSSVAIVSEFEKCEKINRLNLMVIKQSLPYTIEAFLTKEMQRLFGCNRRKN